MLIGGGEKLYDAHAMHKLAQERMPDLQGAVVPDADHIAAMAQPDDVNNRIIRFLQESVGTSVAASVRAEEILSKVVAQILPSDAELNAECASIFLV